MDETVSVGGKDLGLKTDDGDWKKELEVVKFGVDDKNCLFFSKAHHMHFWQQVLEEAGCDATKLNAAFDKFRDQQGRWVTIFVHGLEDKEHTVEWFTEDGKEVEHT